MKQKRRMSVMIIIIILVLVLGIVSYAFFNYTKTGNMNNVTVGRINFQSSQNNTINLTNVFPTDANNLNSTNSSTVTINISGDTNYDKGIEYKVSIVEVENTVNNKEIPISFNVTTSNLGTKSNSYHSEKGSTTNVYNLIEGGLAENDKDILIGYIKPDENGINGSINITAYIDKENIGISDTVSRIENNNLVYGETPGDWIDGRTILTTSEWNSLSLEGISFKVKVEAIEGTWIEEPDIFVLKSPNNIQEWKDIRGNITSIEFSTNPIVPANAITSFDATDLTSAGPVTIYTLDDGLGNNTYKAVICAADVIYAPAAMGGFFQAASKLVTFNGENFKVDNVTNMAGLFFGCSSLENIIGVSDWNTSKVIRLNNTFAKCSSLKNVNGIANWNISSVQNMSGMFINCTGLQNIDGLLNWNTSNVTTLNSLFSGCSKLQTVNGLVNWNTSKVTDMSSMFANCLELQSIDGLANWDTTLVTTMSLMFASCRSIQNMNAIINWNTSRVTSMGQMFNECSSINEVVDLKKWDMSKVKNTTSMFQYVTFETIKMPNNYTRIDNYMFNHNSSYTGESFTIPKTVTSIGRSHVFYDFGLDGVFNKFVVENGSTSLKTINDVLYTYDGTRLIAVPRGKTFTNKTFELPEGVTFLNELSFSRNQNIDTLVLPNSYVIDRYIDANNNSYGFVNTGNSLTLAIYAYTSIKWYEVKNDNTRYSSDSGCIYSKDGTELIAVPYHYSGVLNIKAGTTTIGQEAFWTDADAIYAIADITGINIPASVTTIDAEQLTLLNKLMRRSTNPVTITIDSGNTSYRISNNQIVAI